MRKALLVSLAACALAAVAVALSPYWIEFAARPLLRRVGVEIGEWQRVGYTRVRLRDVVWARGATRVEAEKVEVSTPLLHAWRRDSPAAVENWRVVVTRSTAQPDRSGPKFGANRVQQLLVRRIVPQLNRWLGHATATDGEITWPGANLKIDRAEWVPGRLDVSGVSWREHSAHGTITIADDDVLAIDAALDDEPARAQARWTPDRVTGQADLWRVPAELSAEFTAESWIPEAAELVSREWSLPGADLRLGSVYQTVSGRAAIRWHGRDFDVDVVLDGVPLETTRLPRLEIRAKAQGDRQSWRLSELHAQSPFATADLSEPVEFFWQTGFASRPAELRVRADLSQQRAIAASGIFEGELVVQPQVDAEQHFKLSARGVKFDGIEMRSLALDGHVRWPVVELARMEATMDEATRFSAEGAYDAVQREIRAANVSGTLGRDWFGDRLPESLTWRNLAFRATAEGPLTELRHRGNVTVNAAQFSRLNPIDAEAAWDGAGPSAEAAQATITAGDSRIALAGSVTRSGARLTQWTQTIGGRELWHLAAPAVVEWTPALRIENLKLEGESVLAASVGAAPDFSFEIAGRNLRDQQWRDWVDWSAPSWWMERLALSGRRENGRLLFKVESDGEVGLKPRAARVALQARSDGEKFELTSLRVLDQERVLTDASGVLPIAWDARRGGSWQFDPDDPLSLHVRTEPDSPVWDTLAAFWGLRISGASANADLKGTLRQPEGSVDLHVERIVQADSTPEHPGIPAIENGALVLRVDRSGARLEALDARVDGQAVHASGELPLSSGDWSAIWEEKELPSWRKWTGRIEIPDAQMEPLARRFPSLIATQGRISGALNLERGTFSGALKIRGAATRPLASLGVVQEINADLTLDDRTVRVDNFSGRIGGQPVGLAGTVVLPADRGPEVNLSLKGDRVPLARRSGLLVRADFDLHARSQPSGLVRLSGEVNVRDCLILADLASLLPSGPRGLPRQPPYFSIDIDPFRNWPLDVNVRSDRTIRVRTAVFKGEASARFRLGGTLGEPRAVGELTVDQGQVLFPFAAFDVRLGVVRLQEADPFHPKLQLNAQARRYGYDLRMEATGSPESPNVALSSMPALDSAEVLLLVMTGQKPASETFTANGQQRLARVGTYVGQELIQGLGVGGDEDRLEIQTGEQVSLQGRETYRIEYKLDDQWSLTGEYDEFDDYNAGVKWRVYTEGGERDSR